MEITAQLPGNGALSGPILLQEFRARVSGISHLFVALVPYRTGVGSVRTTRRYDPSRGNLDRSPGYLLVGYISRARRATLPSRAFIEEP